ncbi:MAG: DUF3604 domain-containing protein [Deltaproteobacteria bacterium]|nr:DUF3604 domain-containing protein [Deltaproteobacteria bacterium]
MRCLALLPVVATLVAARVACASTDETTPSYSPRLRPNPSRNLYWGDTHLHTSLSFDANASGNRLPPESAYRFAKGEVVLASSGLRALIDRPLDFLVVSDHAEYLGLLAALRADDPAVLGTPDGRRLRDRVASGAEGSVAVSWEIARSATTGEAIAVDPRVGTTAWHRLTAAADAANEPGRFTAMIGFEWTSMPGGDNLHRVVLFRDGADRANRVTPFSVFDSEDPADLWRFLERYEATTGGRAIAIPHNSNVSNGRMFTRSDFAGRPMTESHARARARWEPIVEVTQTKGDSETHPLLSPDDPFADFERWDKGNLLLMAAKKPEMLPFEYVRSALGIGLALERRIGVNPYELGMIGSTDSHTSLSTAEEDNYWGKVTPHEPHAGRLAYEVAPPQNGTGLRLVGWEFAASGYAAVWASENTREAIFDAMTRRETYATTGPRIALRFFGGWSFADRDADGVRTVERGYAAGVPMGGRLPSRPRGVSAPGFLVWATKDASGANLDRVQIVKGALDAKGRVRERIYDVALSDPARRKPAGVEPVGDTVDVARARYANSIGATELRTFWQDPDFDPAEPAFYYVRVLEIPTPRWTAYDAERFGVDASPEVPMVLQERAYSSPIWYRP